jgi:uncharacterized protein YqeY
MKKIQKDLAEALKAKDTARVSALRMLLSSLKSAEKELREELPQEREEEVLSSYARRCKESIKEFEKGGRDDLVAKERAELEIVNSYLPEQLGEAEIEREIAQAIEELGAQGPRDTGKVIGAVMKKLKGRVDGALVNRKVSEKLKQ